MFYFFKYCDVGNLESLFIYLLLHYNSIFSHFDAVLIVDVFYSRAGQIPFLHFFFFISIIVPPDYLNPEILIQKICFIAILQKNYWPT